MTPQKPIIVIDSRHLKIIAAKKDKLKDALVFINLNQDKYGTYDISVLRKVAEEINKIEPNGTYFISADYEISFYDKEELKNRDLVVTVNNNHMYSDTDEARAIIEKEIHKAVPYARSIEFIHNNASLSVM